jgi:hypothetical protein
MFGLEGIDSNPPRATKHVALLDASGLVVNVVSLAVINDTDNDDYKQKYSWTPPEGHSIVDLDENVGIGWKWTGKKWIEPTPIVFPQQKPYEPEIVGATNDTLLVL